MGLRCKFVYGILIGINVLTFFSFQTTTTTRKQFIEFIEPIGGRRMVWFKYHVSYFDFSMERRR